MSLFTSLVLVIGSLFGVTQDNPIQEITPSVFLLGTSSGNVLASVGADGALLIGTPSRSSTPQLQRFLATRTTSANRYVFISAEHSGSEGDSGWGREGAFVVMQEQGLEQLGGHTMGEPRDLPAGLVLMGVGRPHVSFSEVLSFDLNGDAIHIIHQQPGYSPADAVVHFHVANLVYFGEQFPGDGYPDVDTAMGSTLAGLLQNLTPWISGNARIVPARGGIVTRDDLKSYTEMISAVRDRVQRLIDAGLTKQEVINARPTADFDSQFGHGRVSPTSFVRSVYALLKKK